MKLLFPVAEMREVHEHFLDTEFFSGLGKLEPSRIKKKKERERKKKADLKLKWLIVKLQGIAGIFFKSRLHGLLL